MTTLTEAELEQAALDWLAGLGWQVVHGPNTAPDTPETERTDYGMIGASAIKCCYAAAGSGTGAEETGLRAPVSRKTSIRDHKGIVVAKKMSRKVSRRVVRPACIAGVRISRPNFRAPCGRTKL